MFRCARTPVCWTTGSIVQWVTTFVLLSCSLSLLVFLFCFREEKWLLRRNIYLCILRRPRPSLPFFFFFFFFARSLCGGRGGFSSLARNRRESAQLTVHTLHQPSAKWKWKWDSLHFPSLSFFSRVLYCYVFNCAIVTVSLISNVIPTFPNFFFLSLKHSTVHQGR
jgi:hypothetical protein